MEISEEALFSALAQINQKNKFRGSKRIISKSSETIIRKANTSSLKVDQIFELEKQIISILLVISSFDCIIICKFMIFSPVANLMHHPLHLLPPGQIC